MITQDRVQIILGVINLPVKHKVAKTGKLFVKANNTNRQTSQDGNKMNLAKPDPDLDESPTVTVGEMTTTKQLGNNRGILKPSWAFVETNKIITF